MKGKETSLPLPKENRYKMPGKLLPDFQVSTFSQIWGVLSKKIFNKHTKKASLG